MADASGDVVHRLMTTAGTTYAQAAGITLRDKPQPLFQLLMLCSLMSKPISAEIATDAARELFALGLRGPHAVEQANRIDMIRAFARTHYVRYDESTASRLPEMAALANERYRGDLRRLAREANHDTTVAARLLKEFKGIGDIGADIFLREAQMVWRWARPYFDQKALASARQLGLPTQSDKLAALAPRGTAKLASALIRVSLDSELREQVAVT